MNNLNLKMKVIENRLISIKRVIGNSMACFRRKLQYISLRFCSKLFTGLWMIILLILAPIINNHLLADTELPDIYQDEIAELVSRLEEKDVPGEWFYENFHRANFSYYANIDNYFTNMAEHRVSRGEIDIQDYKNHFGVDTKVRRGLQFIDEHRELLEKVEERNGIHYELIVAILGMETNFAEQRQRGSFYVFDTLVSQYLLLPNRRRFAVNELAALYNFSHKTGRSVDYFVGSFAGASGWGQFIPTSLMAYFISADGNPENTDIFSIEDTLISIENYMASHGLNRNSIDSPERKRRAVFAYNRSEAYVEAVLYMYREFRSQSGSS